MENTCEKFVLFWLFLDTKKTRANLVLLFHLLWSTHVRDHFTIPRWRHDSRLQNKWSNVSDFCGNVCVYPTSAFLGAHPLTATSPDNRPFRMYSLTSVCCCSAHCVVIQWLDRASGQLDPSVWCRNESSAPPGSRSRKWCPACWNKVVCVWRPGGRTSWAWQSVRATAPTGRSRRSGLCHQGETLIHTQLWIIV